MEPEINLMKEELVRLCQLHKFCPTNLNQIVDKTAKHFSLLLKWNQKISLTALTDPKQAAEQLYFESLFATKFISTEINSIVDIGTGAGFPGLPICFAKTALSITLIEADKRKAAFLAEVRRSLNLSNLKIVNDRFENLSLESDLITVRALEKLENQVPKIIEKSTKSKLIMLFVSLQTANNILSTYKNKLLSRKSEIIALPESKNRVLLLFHKNECFT
jgi:16S rRNA (guanine(527)-N(7))-methyltransferase RsmG